jgi:small-conductance mechanosensitive channel
VFIDGLFLFDVAGAANLTAAERAATIETNLQAVLEGPGEPPPVRVETRQTGQGEPVPILFAGDRYLMTVTAADVAVGGAGSPTAQANQWLARVNQVLVNVQRERQGRFSRTTLLGLALAALAVALALHWLSGWLWQHWLQPLVDRLPGSPDRQEEAPTGLGLLVRLGLWGVRGAIWVTTLSYITRWFPLTRRVSHRVSRSLNDGLFARSLALEGQAYSLFDLLLLLATLLALVILANTATNVLRSRFLHITGINQAAQEAIAVLGKYTLILLGGVVILQLWGIDLSSIALIASGLGIGIGLGLQGLVKDVVSGLVMVFERPVQVGDFVDFGPVKGTVTRIGSRSTEIRTLDQVAIIVPNSRFLENEIVNWSHGNPVSRIRLPVGVAYHSDPEQVKTTLLAACQTHQEVLTSPAPQVFFLGFGDNALNFELLVWIAQPHRQLVIKSDLYFAIEAAFRQHHIEVPFPQQDLHIRSGSLPIDLSQATQRWLGQLSQDSGGDRSGPALSPSDQEG